jgi:hypothetical protein
VLFFANLGHVLYENPLNSKTMLLERGINFEIPVLGHLLQGADEHSFEYKQSTAGNEGRVRMGLYVEHCKDLPVRRTRSIVRRLQQVPRS